MRSGSLVLLSVLASGLGGAPPVLAESQLREVYLESEQGDVGGGLAFRSGSHCYIATAGHIVKLGSIKIIGNRRGRATGKLIRSLPGDLALLEVDGDTTEICPPDPLKLPFKELAIDANGSASLLRRAADGSMVSLRVRIQRVDARSLNVEALETRQAPLHGWSGSTLWLGERQVGMLLAVNPASPSAQLLRLDRAFEQLQPLLPRVSDDLALELRRWVEAQRRAGLDEYGNARMLASSIRNLCLELSQVLMPNLWAPPARDVHPGFHNNAWQNHSKRLGDAEIILQRLKADTAELGASGVDDAVRNLETALDRLFFEKHCPDERRPVEKWCLPADLEGQHVKAKDAYRLVGDVCSRLDSWPPG